VAGSVVITDQGEDGVTSERDNVLVLDEWDYRRSGYRLNWCQVREKPVESIRSNFVAGVLARRQAMIVNLRRQFEQLRTDQRFSGRQSDGVDLDLDAVVEARCDFRAGISPSENLFVRLLRNDRDIATIVLVDMSSSTEGWIGTVLKEALVVLGEAFDTVGDQFGIYGFSGMRRSRCEIFTIKRLAESYSEEVRERLGAISSREYTRLGPAVRWAARLLQTVEARTRLLLILTDGKPEDYDDYKGEYAIEDSRKALQEVRGDGLHTFGITVDQQSHDYLPHLFGEGNYIFVDDLAKLPHRLVEMYRLLTL
jgi:nitric oxide reductase NorD protein